MQGGVNPTRMNQVTRWIEEYFEALFMASHLKAQDISKHANYSVLVYRGSKPNVKVKAAKKTASVSYGFEMNMDRLRRASYYLTPVLDNRLAMTVLFYRYWYKAGEKMIETSYEHWAGNQTCDFKIGKRLPDQAIANICKFESKRQYVRYLQKIRNEIKEFNRC